MNEKLRFGFLLSMEEKEALFLLSNIEGGMSKAAVLKSQSESNTCNVVKDRRLRFTGATCLGQGKTAKNEAPMNAPVMMIMTIKTSIVRIMFQPTT